MLRFSPLLILLTSLFPAIATSTDWPHPRGPRIDGTVLATGTFEASSIGLELAWKSPLGPGYSGISVSEGLAVTGLGDSDGNWTVAFDTETGHEVWRSRLSDVYRGHNGSTDGPLSSPVIGDEHVYALDPHGELFALRLVDGTPIWRRNLKAEFDARVPEFGFTTTPLLAGGMVVVQIGGREGQTIVGLDAETGEPRWSLGDDKIEYQSPSVMTLAGRTQVVAAGVREIVGIDAEDGEVLWTHRLTGKDKTLAANPTFIGEDRFVLFFANRLTAYRLLAAGNGDYRLEELYRSPELGSTYAAPVFHDGYLYGFRGQILTCVDAATGRRMWRSRPPGGDGLILVDGRLVIFAARGSIVVADASPEGYRERARLQALKSSSLTWPSFSEGKVFVRNLEELAAVSILRQPAGKGAQASSDSRPSLAEAVPAEHLMTQWVRRIEKARKPKVVIDELYAEYPRLPIVDGEHVHFLYRGKAQDVALAGTMLEGDALLPMQRIADSDLFYRTLRLEPGGRWEYRFQIDYDWSVADPKNPRRVPIPGDKDLASEVMTGGYETASHLADPGTAAGSREYLELSSPILGEKRKVVVWLPPGYDTAQPDVAYPLLVVSGGPGPAWLTKGLLANTLANLVDEGLPPLVAAFVEPADQWWHETGGARTDEYVRMLAEELVPMLDQRYRLTSQRGLMANQNWAFSSALAALRYPEVFDRVGLQSPFLGSGTNPAVRELIESRAGADTLSVYVDWNRHGLRNIDRGFDFVEEGKSLMGFFRDAGYQVTGGEVLDSYGWSGWRNRSDRLLKALFSAE